ncbi:cilia- and flagella-associated protein 74 [Arapaima gigas]
MPLSLNILHAARDQRGSSSASVDELTFLRCISPVYAHLKHLMDATMDASEDPFEEALDTSQSHTQNAPCSVWPKAETKGHLDTSQLPTQNASSNVWPEGEAKKEDAEEQNVSDDEPPLATTDEMTEFSMHWDDNIAGRRSHGEKVRMFKLRRNLDQLDLFYKQKEQEVLKAREELKACQRHIAELSDQRDKVDKEMERQKKEENTAALFRLRAHLNRLSTELNTEEELEAQLSLALREHEVEFCQVEVELGRLSLLRQELQQEVKIFEDEKAQRATERLQKEEEAARKTQRRIQQERRRLNALAKEEKDKRLKVAEEIRVSQQKASVYLKETVKRIQQAAAAKELDEKELQAKRMQAVLSLKNNIATIQENLRIQQIRKKGRALKKKEEESRLMERLEAEGYDVTKYMNQLKKLKDRERKKKKLEEKQQTKGAETASKLSMAESLVQKQQKQKTLLSPPRPPSMAKTSSPKKSEESLVQDLELVTTEPEEEPVRSEQLLFSSSSDEESQASGDSSPQDWESSEEMEDRWEKELDDGEVEESLALPEFRGLWEQTNWEYTGTADDEPFLSSQMEEEPSAMTPEMVWKKYASEKLFKGRPFVSKPESITFKDIEVGKTYKKKITLTNVTYFTNYCKFLSVSEHLKDFISVQFEPPGPMSPGMACDFLTTFKPMINRELEGYVHFLSVVGPFNVPVKCMVKKCELAVDCSVIDFGAHVVGQTISRAITLTNRGALGTHFILVPSASSRQPPSPRPLPSQGEQANKELLNPEVPLEGEDNVRQPEPAEPGEQTGSIDPSIGTEQGQRLIHNCLGPEQPIEDPVSVVVSSVHSEPIQEDFQHCSDIKVGEVKEGEIGPFEFIKLDILFTPSVPGEAKMDFYIQFSDPSSQPILITVRGLALSIPVWITQPNIDLKICMYDRLYQDTIVVQSKASTTLRLMFQVCKELRNHMEILPKTGYIQAQSTFHSQLKFLPRSSLLKDASQFFDSETGVLEVPLTIQADQVHLISFTVYAIITTSDLEFDMTEVDFGHCSVFESVKTSVHLRNLSLLPQDFGFVGIPKYIDIQPNDGFGTLLPLETLELDITFSPQKAGKFNFQLVCKSGINRQFRLSCQAVGVHPPLELSHSLVEFAATALGDCSTAVLHVINPHTGSSELTRPMPRIGNGPIAPVGPRLFEFIIPNNAEISIAPAVGRVQPGQRCLVQVSFRPQLCDKQVREEAVRLVCQAHELQEKEAEQAELEAMANQQVELEVPKKETQPDTKARGRKATPTRPPSKPTLKEEAIKAPPPPKPHSPFLPPSPEDIQEGSQEYVAGKTSLLRSFPGRIHRYVVPCFISDSDTPDRGQGEGLPYSPHNTLYLELRCPAVRPFMAIVSNGGNTTINFQQVAIGQTAKQRVAVQNFCERTLELKSSLLDVNSPFMVLNALRPLPPGATQSILLGFTPRSTKEYYDTVEIRSKEMILHLLLLGVGVHPTVTCSQDGGLMDFGYVLEKESISQTFTLQNTCTLQVKFCVHLESVSDHQKQQGLPEFLTPDLVPTVGTQNYSGMGVFSASPAEGAIPPGKTQEVTVTFRPDHESLYFSDRLIVEIMNQQTVCELKLKGAAGRRPMFLTGGDPLGVTIESLATLPLGEDSKHAADTDKAPRTVLLTFRALHTDDTVLPAVRQLEVGFLRWAQSRKQVLELCWDSLPTLQQKGFSVEPAFDTLEIGTQKTITVTWAPPVGHTLNEVVHATSQLTLKGDDVEVYSVTLLATVGESIGPEPTPSY